MRRVFSRAAAVLAVITGVALGASSTAASAAPVHAAKSAAVKTAPAKTAPTPSRTTGITYSQQDWWW